MSHEETPSERYQRGLREQAEAFDRGWDGEEEDLDAGLTQCEQFKQLAEEIHHHADAVIENYALGTPEYSYLCGRRDTASALLCCLMLDITVEQLRDMLRETAWGTYDPEARKELDEQAVQERLRAMLGG